MFGSLLMGQGTLAALSVSASEGNIEKAATTGTAFAGIQINTSGTEYSNASGSSEFFSFSRGKWLDSGASSGVWVERTTSDTLDWKDAGTGRLQLDTTREFGISQSLPVTPNVATVTFDYYDAASGGNLLDSVTITITAYKESEA